MEHNNIYENRDRLLGEIHADTKSIKKWCEEHDKKDDKRFAQINQKLIFGAFIAVVIAFYSGSLGQILAHTKVGL